MILTKKELLKTLKLSSDNTRIKLNDNRDIIHIIDNGEIVLSPTQPIGHCFRCGEYVYKEEQLDYDGFCPECDENMDYGHEILKINNKKVGLVLWSGRGIPTN